VAQRRRRRAGQQGQLAVLVARGFPARRTGGRRPARGQRVRALRGLRPGRLSSGAAGWCVRELRDRQRAVLGRRGDGDLRARCSFTREHLVAVLAALLVATAPVFEALAGQALPYVASYGLFVLGLLLFDHMRLFERTTSASTALACGLV